MQIVHTIDEFLYAIFPVLKDANNTQIINELEKYYSYGPYKPIITIANNVVTIHIDTQAIISQEPDYRKVIASCEKGKYEEAKPVLKNLIAKNPSNSEYHRIMGQILSDEGDQEEAINCLIDALRWDSKNGWALLMMGNIFAKFKDDVPTAMKYYDQALIANPTDFITMNNIGANLMHQKKLTEAKKYFWDAIAINDKYPNTHYALGMIAEMEGDLHSAFYSTIQAIKLNNNKDALYQNSFRQAFEIAKNIIATDEGKKIFRKYRHQLEIDGNKEVDIIKDESIPTAAKIEIAENYNRPKHLIKFKPNYPAVEHLIMHELVHLDFIIAARKDDLNQVFVSTQQHKREFIKTLEPTIKQFHKRGISEESISKYCSSLFDGLNLQTFNAPIDLFIECLLYNEYPELRPYQFLSFYNLVQEGLKAVTDKNVVEISPKNILSKCKTYNLVSAIQFKELFGIDTIKDFKASPIELKQAKDFYEEFLQYNEDKEPGEEYEMVMHWAEDLQLEKNFDLISETEYRTKTTDIDNLLDSIEKDPYDMESKDPFKEREMDKFQKSQKEIGINMAVVMFMVDAMQFFEGMPKEKVKAIAFDIATQGTQGYSPDKKDYRIHAISGKLFSGYHILAYYYVSWMIAIPEMVSQLQLPYGKEYEIAKTLYNPK
jgi:tetratricopeptide (TPR) repeat protein